MSENLFALKLEGVSKSFGGIHAVSDVDLNVKIGERRALIGPNGAGKTTLFNLITGVIPGDAGVIHLFDQEVTTYSVRQRAILGLGRTYQSAELFLDLKVKENLLLATLGVRQQRLRLLKGPVASETEYEWMEEIASKVGLADRLDVPVSDLSHGEKRQLEIGMALAMQPSLIMLDEPSSGLSPAERPNISRLLEELPADVTVIIIEHDMDIALGFADFVTVLNQGQVIANGRPAEIRSDEHVRAVYLGVADA